jgi:K+-sensing histidine kinase KdpD
LSAQAASIEIILNEGESLSTEERADLLNSIYISTLNLEKLIDNLLEGSSIETGRFAINTQPTDIKKVVFSACESFEPMLKKYGQSFVFNLPNTLPIVLIDDRRINQVLLNLISNACKYGPSNEEIEISAAIIGDFVEVSVSDKGEGISDEEKKTIFSGMTINDSDNGRKQKGFRLGLSVSSTIITTHGGKIGIRDSKYGGSEFYFTVPISGDV